MTALSEFLTLEEATKSPTAIRAGIKNLPTAEQVLNMQYVAREVFDPVRRWVGGPLCASSFFRTKELNAAIPGSSKTSQHMTGEAIDIDCDMFGNGTNLGVFEYIRKNLHFDQLILEYPDKEGNPSWVHVSLTRKDVNRLEVLVKLKAKYIPFSAYKPGMV